MNTLIAKNSVRLLSAATQSAHATAERSIEATAGQMKAAATAATAASGIRNTHTNASTLSSSAGPSCMGRWEINPKTGKIECTMIQAQARDSLHGFGGSWSGHSEMWY